MGTVDAGNEPDREFATDGRSELKLMTTLLFSPQFVIGSIRIGTIQGASCLNMGNNFPTNFTSNKKTNQGFGNVTGDHNTLRDARSLVEDMDMVDMVNETNAQLPEWLEQMMREDTAND
jgi:hypothetical protein